jgi:4'-phosphopantetheinyl transferase
MKDGLQEHLQSHVVVRVASISSPEGGSAEEAYLDRPDRERAARFRFPEDRARFVLGRALLGRCLERYLGYRAQPLGLTYSAKGRPLLPGVEFSISHAHDLVAVALSVGTLVGVDLEYVRADFNARELGEQIFSPEDLKIFQALAPEEQPRVFFHAWTGKEACLKACGLGIAGGMTQVAVPLSRQDAVTRIAQADSSWCLQALPLPADYAGHLVWNDSGKEMDFRMVDGAEIF